MNGPYLADTNVVSEWSRARPSAIVDSWARDAFGSLHLSVITVEEILYGLGLDRDPDRSRRLRHWVDEDLLPTFGDRILDVSPAVAAQSGVFRSTERRAGRVLSTSDALIAGTAKVHGLTLATRNTRDFAWLGIELVNPWEWKSS